jgi:hypothetical protein
LFWSMPALQVKIIPLLEAQQLLMLFTDRVETQEATKADSAA